LPAVDHLAQLPVKSAFIFGIDPDAAHANAENAAILSADSARSVLSEFASRVRTHNGIITPADFKRWMNDIKAATGVKGKELYHPIRIALTGSHSSPEFDRIIPLIEEGAAMGLAIPTIHDRIEQFVGV
jgi:glutamyl/glutaminyl-tRNA synthetase